MNELHFWNVWLMMCLSISGGQSSRHWISIYGTVMLLHLCFQSIHLVITQQPMRKRQGYVTYKPIELWKVLSWTEKYSIVLVTDVNVLHSNNQRGVGKLFIMSFHCVNNSVYVWPGTHTMVFHISTQIPHSTSPKTNKQTKNKSNLTVNFFLAWYLHKSISFSIILNNSRFRVKKSLLHS